MESMKPILSKYPDYVGRTCQFKNLYYHPKRKVFHYYVSPAEARLMNYLEKNDTVSIAQIMIEKMTTAWSFIPIQHVKRQLLVKRLRHGNWNAFRWQPRLHFVHNQSDLPSWRELQWPATMRKNVVLLYHPSYSFNFGHFLLDDVSTWFQMLLAFGHIHLDTAASGSDMMDTVPLPVMVETPSGDPLYRCTVFHYKWPTCVGMYRKFLPKLLHVEWEDDIDILRFSNFLQRLPRPTVLSDQPDLIRLDEVIVGSGRLPHYGCDGSCSIGRVTWMPLFRKWMLRQLLLPRNHDSSPIPLSSSSSSTDGDDSWSQRPLDRVVDTTKDYITFSIPFNSSRSSGLTNFSDIIQAAQQRYGLQRVQVANLANMTLDEQAWLVLHSCIFVTYEGGGSHTSIFLPPGATIVLYNSNLNYTKARFQVMYRDRSWYDTMAHVQKVWVSEQDRNNVALAMDILKQYTANSN